MAAHCRSLPLNPFPPKLRKEIQSNNSVWSIGLKSLRLAGIVGTTRSVICLFRYSDLGKPIQDSSFGTCHWWRIIFFSTINTFFYGESNFATEISFPIIYIRKSRINEGYIPCRSDFVQMVGSERCVIAWCLHCMGEQLRCGPFSALCLIWYEETWLEVMFQSWCRRLE